MATLKRCDVCNALSDEKNVGHIGREWDINEYNHCLGTIKLNKDMCRNCVKKTVEGSSQ